MKPIEVKELKEYDLNSIFPGNLSAQIRESLEDQNAELVRSLGLRTDAIQVYKKNRVWKIKFVGIAGIISVKDYEIEIMPKFLNEGTDWKESFFNMIYVAQSGRIMAQKSRNMIKKKMNFYDHIARIFIEEMEQALQKDPIHTYRDEIECSRFKRGHLLIYAQMLHAISNPGILYYEHDVFDTDNEFNYLLRWATETLVSKVNDQGLRIQLKQLRDEIPTVTNRYKLPIGSKVPPQYGHYEKAIEIANTLANGSSTSMGNNGKEGYGYVVAMEVIYEKFIENILRSMKSYKCSVNAEAQTSHVFATHIDSDMRSYYTVPDNKVYINSEPKILVDAKYKNNFVNSRSRKPVNSDAYQLFASMVSHKCKNGILVSPCENSVPTYSKHWTIDDNGEVYTICSLMIDLADLSTHKKVKLLRENIMQFIEDELKI